MKLVSSGIWGIQIKMHYSYKEMFYKDHFFHFFNFKISNSEKSKI